MSYVSIEFYKNTYQGNSIPDDKLQGALEKASVDIDTITRMKIKKLGGFSQLSKYEQMRVQLAVCSQADHSYMKPSLDGVSSYSIGDVSVSVAEGSTKYNKGCLQYLSSTRLLYRGL